MLGGEAAGEVLGFVVASVKFEVLTAIVDFAEAELPVLGVGEVAVDFGVGMATHVEVERAAELEAEHMEQVVKELEPHSEVPLAFEVACTAGTGHTVDTAACRGCIQGNAAGSTAGTGAAAGTARLLEFGEQLLDLD